MKKTKYDPSWADEAGSMFTGITEVFSFGNDFLRAVFEEQNAMIDYHHNDTYLAVYDPGAAILD